MSYKISQNYTGKQIKSLEAHHFSGYPAGSVTIRFEDGAELVISCSRVNYGHGEMGSCLEFKEASHEVSA